MITGRDDQKSRQEKGYFNFKGRPSRAGTTMNNGDGVDDQTTQCSYVNRNRVVNKDGEIVSQSVAES